MDGKIVGYGSIEASELKLEQGGDRLFLVVSWSRRGACKIADTLLARLLHDASAMRVSRLWTREYANDKPFIEYLLSRGFEVGREYIYEGTQLANLSLKDWAGDRFAS